MGRREWSDIALTAAVAVPVGMDAWWNSEGTRQADGLSYALVLIPVVALLFRRRWPIPVAAICMAALAIWYTIGHRGELTGLPTMVALYTVAVRGDRRRTLVAGACTVVLFGLLAVITGDAGLPGSELGLPVAALLLGETVRGRRELLAEQRLRAEREQAGREARARERAQQERLFIARELHDVAAHTIAAMNVQAGLAAEALARRPDVAGTALAQVRALGRHAMSELRATVGVLRNGRPETSTAPAPTLADLESLADGVRATGLRVTLEQDGITTPVTPVVQLAAYRIVQESLTNVIRHAGAGQATVKVDHDGRGLVIEVTDDGTGGSNGGSNGGSTGSSIDSGFGLAGLAERAAGVGGTVECGQMAEGGFRVRAFLPTEGDPR